MNDAQLEPTQPVLSALSALPFALLAGLAWQAWLPWPAILAGVIAVWAFRRNAGSAQYRMFSSVFAALFVFAVPPHQGLWLIERFGAYFVALALLYLVGAALDGAWLGSAWAWLAPLVLFLAQPTAFGAFGGLGLAVLGALEGRGRRGGTAVRSRGALGVIGLAGLAVLALTAPWRDAGGLVALEEVREPRLERTGQARARAEAGTSTAVTSRPKPPATTPDNAGLERPFIALSSVMLALLLGVVALALRERAFNRHGTRGRLADLIPLVAAAILGVIVYLYGASAWLNGSASSPGHQAAFTSSTSGGTPPSDAGSSDPLSAPPAAPDSPWPTAVLALLAAGAVLWWLARLRPAPAPITADAGPEPDLERRVQATNRVRAAYRAFLELAGGAGVPRASSETPAEFAARVIERHDQARDPTLSLTRLYEPVRYGQLADEVGALEAEQALKTLRGILNGMVKA